MSNVLGGNGNSHRKSALLEVCANPLSLVYPFNPNTNEIYFAGERTVLADMTGMVGSGKDKHTRIATVELPQDSELIDLFGRPLRIGAFKPNDIIKRSYRKDPRKRAVLDRLMNRNVASLLEALVEMQPKEDSEFTPVELDLVLINRGPYDNLRWTRALYDFGLLSHENMERNTRIANEVLEYISFVANFSIPVEEAIRREIRREEGDLGEVMKDREFLEVLQKHYNALSEEIRVYGHPLGFSEDVECIYIDGTADVESNSRKFLGALKRRIISSVKGKEYRNGHKGRDTKNYPSVNYEVEPARA